MRLEGAGDSPAGDRGKRGGTISSGSPWAVNRPRHCDVISRAFVPPWSLQTARPATLGPDIPCGTGTLVAINLQAAAPTSGHRPQPCRKQLVCHPRGCLRPWRTRTSGSSGVPACTVPGQRPHACPLPVQTARHGCDRSRGALPGLFEVELQPAFAKVYEIAAAQELSTRAERLAIEAHRVLDA